MSEHSREVALGSQALAALTGLSGTYRLALAVVLLIAFVVPAVVIWSSGNEHYRVLTRGIRHKTDVQAITAELEKRGVRYQLSESGRTVMVPERRHTEALEHLQRERLFPSHDGDWKELLDKSPSLGLLPEVQRMQRLRMLEMDIARTIAMCDSVEFARVHITQPKESLFRNEAAPVTASVFVDLTPDKRLTVDQVATIKKLVSHAVEGLSALNITLCDSSGTDYSSRASPVVSAPVPVSAARELEMARLAEAVLEGKVNDHLRRLFGPEAFAASVVVEMDASQRPTEIALAAGAAPQPSASPTVVSDSRVRAVESRGHVRRVSVSILVDSRALPGGRFEAQFREMLEADVKAAVGFRQSRGDHVSLLCAPFHRPGLASVAPGSVERRSVPAAASALSLVASHFHAFWVGQVVVLIFVLGLLVKHVGAPPQTGSSPETERSYPVRIDQVLTSRRAPAPAAPALESFALRTDLDVPAALACVDERTLVVVLRTAAEPVRELILSNLTPDRARQLSGQIGAEGPVPLHQAEDARRRLAEHLHRVARKGVA